MDSKGEKNNDSLWGKKKLQLFLIADLHTLMKLIIFLKRSDILNSSL